MQSILCVVVCHATGVFKAFVASVCFRMQYGETWINRINRSVQCCEATRVRLVFRAPGIPRSLALSLGALYVMNLLRNLPLRTVSSFKSTISTNGFLRKASLSTLRRSYLYVPSSSDRMLEKSLKAGSDVLIYDLEDSVSPKPEDKLAARKRLKAFLKVRRSGSHLPVRYFSKLP